MSIIKNMREIFQGRKATQPAPSSSLFAEVALEQVISYLMRIPDPDLVLAQLGMGRHDLRKLETDDEISAALETRRDAVISTPWRLEGVEGEIAKWLDETIRPHISEALRCSWNAVPYGYAVLETVYSKPSPRIGIASIREKPMEWFEPTREGGLKYTPPANNITGAIGGIPIEVDNVYKFLVTIRNPTYRQPYGEALLSRSYWPWFFRHNGWRYWMQFLERFSDPLLLGNVHDPQTFVTTMKNLGISAVVGVGTEEKLTAVTAAGAGEFEKIEQALTRRIQKLILGQTLTTDVGTTGSFAAAKIHDGVRDDRRKSDIRLVSSTIQRLVNALWSLNQLAPPVPKFVMADDTGLEIPRSERDGNLARYGIAKFTEQYLLDRYDFEPGDFTVPVDNPARTPVPAPAPLANQSALTLGALRRSNRTQRFTEDQQWVESLIGSAVSQYQPIIPAETLKKTILASENPEALVKNLANLYRGNDPSAFQELMERSLFAADVLGYVTADQQVGGVPNE